eukprot:gnl/TRDRNA2_/TRDRNA2_195432_c0_seq1.p1 gnl/TRDRNA2_/TRDRNA2_195432_c0~~gnl/TRDRNA2_/TRDRNA2_195432_c0_seq1.p1  ORF type:complete len:350 (+),score=44.73 gnl/TRDRNA2_/TRDRNA2_195432_c0_seq1:97-1146(+)
MGNEPASCGQSATHGIDSDGQHDTIRIDRMGSDTLVLMDSPFDESSDRCAATRDHCLDARSGNCVAGRRCIVECKLHGMSHALTELVEDPEAGSDVSRAPNLRAQRLLDKRLNGSRCCDFPLHRNDKVRIPHGAELHELSYSLTWRGVSPSFHAESSCVMFELGPTAQQSNLLGAVYFANQIDDANGIRHCSSSPDSNHAGGYSEAIEFNLDRLQSNVDALFFIVTIFSKGWKIKGAAVHQECCSTMLVDETSDEQLCIFEVDSFSGNTIVAAMLIRTGDDELNDGDAAGWTFVALGRGFDVQNQSSSGRALAPQLRKLLAEAGPNKSYCRKVPDPGMHVPNSTGRVLI